MKLAFVMFRDSVIYDSEGHISCLSLGCLSRICTLSSQGHEMVVCFSCIYIYIYGLVFASTSKVFSRCINV